MVKIINPRNSLFKIIDIYRYSREDIWKTFKVYLNAGFKVEVYYVY